MEKKLLRVIGTTLVLSLGTVGCGDLGRSEQITACAKLTHKVPAKLGSGGSNDPKVLIEYNSKFDTTNQFEDPESDGFDPIDKVGEAECYDPNHPDQYYLTKGAWLLRQDYIARNEDTQTGN